jgi:hypothetical protein
MKIDVALVLSALLLVVSVADFFTSRARSKRIEDRETAIEAKESAPIRGDLRRVRHHDPEAANLIERHRTNFLSKKHHP